MGDEVKREYVHEWTDVEEGCILITTHCERGQAKQQIPNHIVNDQMFNGTWNRYMWMCEQVNEEAIEKAKRRECVDVA